MKTNAILRIIIWSLVLVLLVSILSAGLLYRNVRRTSESPAETAVPVPLSPSVSEDGSAETKGIVTATAVNVRSAPNSDSSIVGMLAQDDTVVITRRENVGGEGWSYITSPISGWVKTEYLNLEASATAPMNGEISLDARQIQEIDIEWATGNITIQPAEVDAIQISESTPSDPKFAMIWRQSGDKLTIQFCESIKLDFNFGISINDVISKDLMILVPMGWECDSLDIEAASATVDVKDLVIREVDFDGASGTCNFVNCVVDQLDLDTASGDVYYTGSLNILDCDAASASVYAVFDNVPNRIDMDSMSGDLDITLPSAAGFTVTMDGLSTDFISDFGYSRKNGSFYRGNGACKISMDAMSGDIYLREYKEAAAAAIPDPTAAHHHTDACTTDPDSCPENATHHTEPHHP